jgi:hypothetical protein
MNKRETAQLIVDFWHRTMMHHAIWYGEVIHQYGREKAWEILQVAYQKSKAIQLKRLAKTLDFAMDEDVPAPLLEMPEEKLAELKEAVAINWLANDGVWFQAVEFSRGMLDAKRINDSSWAQFSPFEARSIKQILNLGDHPGLEGLKKALDYRLYATINKQSIHEEKEDSFVFQMNECRVQVARKRKGLEDYPCKSGGLIEYSSFAETIDPRIKTECLSCPPDSHPEDYYCAWRFVIEQ